MLLKVTFLAVLALAAARPKNWIPSVHVPFIVNGEDADIADFPWQGSMENGGSHSCGSALIRDSNGGTRYVLTAAHCVDGSSAGDLSVRMGSTTRGSGGDVYNVDRINQHSGYNNGEGTFANDIASLQLSSEASGSNQSPASRGSAGDGDSVTISGWGRTSGGGGLPRTLQRTTTTVISNSRCNDMVGGIYDGHICFFNSRSGSCNGDSGGPAVRGSTLVGLTSWGIVGCPVDSAPSVYARVSYFSGWISSNT